MSTPEQLAEYKRLAARKYCDCVSGAGEEWQIYFCTLHKAIPDLLAHIEEQQRKIDKCEQQVNEAVDAERREIIRMCATEDFWDLPGVLNRRIGAEQREGK